LQSYSGLLALLASIPPGEGGDPYNGLYGDAPPERGTFFGLQVWERPSPFFGLQVCERATFSGCRYVKGILFRERYVKGANLQI